MQSLTSAQMPLDITKQRLGLPDYPYLGALEAGLTSDQTILVRFRAASLLSETPPAWQQHIDMEIGSLHLQLHGVLTPEGALFYARVGSRNLDNRTQESEAVVSASGQELILITADAPPRSALTAPNGQAIFPLAPGSFTLLCAQQTGWEIRIAWLHQSIGDT